MLPVFNSSNRRREAERSGFIGKHLYAFIRLFHHKHHKAFVRLSTMPEANERPPSACESFPEFDGFIHFYPSLANARVAETVTTEASKDA